VKTPLKAWVLGYLIWCLCLVPAALLAMWFWDREWSWKEFATTYIGMAVLLLLYEVIAHWVEHWLRQRRTKRSKG
jgi:amino acid permease